MKKYALAACAALALASLAACDRPAQTSSTTVVKEPVAQNAPPASSSTTIVQPSTPNPSSTTSVTVDAKPAESKPETTETTRSTQRVDTPAGSVTKTETTSTTK